MDLSRVSLSSFESVRFESKHRGGIELRVNHELDTIYFQGQLFGGLFGYSSTFSTLYILDHKSEFRKFRKLQHIMLHYGENEESFRDLGYRLYTDHDEETFECLMYDTAELKSLTFCLDPCEDFGVEEHAKLENASLNEWKRIAEMKNEVRRGFRIIKYLMEDDDIQWNPPKLRVVELSKTFQDLEA